MRLHGAPENPPEENITAVGVDGCPGGWVAVFEAAGLLQARVFGDFAGLVAAFATDASIAVDMPIGLPERAGAGGRGPEALVRPLLGQRQSSVFPIPSRAAIHAECGPFADAAALYDAHGRANRIARESSEPPRAISIQAFGIFPKIRELDALLRHRPELADRVIESHPELAFWLLNQRRSLATPKKVKGRPDAAGLAERRALLTAGGIDPAFLAMPPPRGAAVDDLLDATALLVVARRHRRGEAISFPDPPGRDAFGLPVAIRV